MPILIALVIAVVVSGLAFGIAARRSARTDVADIRAETAAAGASAARRHSALGRFLLQRRDPSTETGLLLTVAVGAAALAILGIGVLLEMVSSNQGFARLDDSAARFGARHATPDITSGLKAITTLGATWFVSLVVVVVGVQQYWQHRRKAPALFLIAAVVSTVAVGNIVKASGDRARPDIARLVGAAGSSFPSGHSAAAAATYASLALLLGRGRSRRARGLLAGAAAALAAAVAASRVLLGVHWLTDVTAGVLLGWTCFALCSIAFGGRVMRFGQPVATAQAAAAAAEPSAAGTPGEPATSSAASHTTQQSGPPAESLR